MDFFVLLLVVVLVLVFVAMVASKRRGQGSAGPDIWPYSAKLLLNGTERKAYQLLRDALPGHLIATQVAMSQLLQVHATGPAWKAAHGRISQKVVDFVVCAPDWSVVAVVEVDGPTHRRASQQKRDTVKDRALAAAGIRIERWDSDRFPTIDAVRTILGTSTQA